jgi:hypothetical protein
VVKKFCRAMKMCSAEIRQQTAMLAQFFRCEESQMLRSGYSAQFIWNYKIYQRVCRFWTAVKSKYLGFGPARRGARHTGGEVNLVNKKKELWGESCQE